MTYDLTSYVILNQEVQVMIIFVAPRGEIIAFFKAGASKIQRKSDAMIAGLKDALKERCKVQPNRLLAP